MFRHGKVDGSALKAFGFPQRTGRCPARWGHDPPTGKIPRCLPNQQDRLIWQRVFLVMLTCVWAPGPSTPPYGIPEDPTVGPQHAGLQGWGRHHSGSGIWKLLGNAKSQCILVALNASGGGVAGAEGSAAHRAGIARPFTPRRRDSASTGLSDDMKSRDAMSSRCDPRVVESKKQ